MQPVDPGRIQSEINVTPLVDVVLVLLILFMIIAPQLDAGPPVQLPETERPPRRDEASARLALTIQHDGALWMDGAPVAADALPERVRAATAGGEREVIVQGDARLTFGAVRRVLAAVESAGLTGVGLVAESPAAAGPGS